MKPLILALFLTVPLAAGPVDDCLTLRHHGKRQEARACFTKLAESADPYVRAEGLWGMERYQDAKPAFEAALKRQPASAHVRVRYGLMFFERFNSAEAETLFKEALQLDPKSAEAHLAMARIASEHFSEKAVEDAKKALELDPKLVEAEELLAYLALEDSDTAKARELSEKAMAMSPEALDAAAVRGSIALLEDKPADEWFARIAQVNPVYGEAHFIAGHFFVINRRYTEAIAEYRKAVELDPRLWEAHAQLGVNLMRLGDDKGARQELETCFNNGYKNAETVNSLTLLDSYKNFKTFTTPTMILRLHKKEADLLQPYFQGEIERALATYQKKYKTTLKGPVQVEVYPDHEDFAVRTMGMPGLGALGVTFGQVVAMDSPSGRPPGQFHWGSTLWHELSHVYVLTATDHRVPRWFTEGMAVYEETAVAPDWGDRLDPEAIQAIQKKKLLPIAQLDRGFIRPTYPQQVIVSYFQAGRICSFIAEKYGYGKLLDMMHGFGALKSTPQVIQENFGMTPEKFDEQFFAWLDKETRNTVEHFGEWKELMKAAAEAKKAKNWDEVIAKASKARDDYPDYIEAGSAYQMLADAYEEKGDKKSALTALEKYSATGGRDSRTIKRLASLEEEMGNKEKAAAALERLNFIYPEDEELHRRLGDLELALNRPPQAIREYQALLASKPLDQATSHYDLARALSLANRKDEARDQVLLSLEAAPGYKPAQRLLLELSK